MLRLFIFIYLFFNTAFAQQLTIATGEWNPWVSNELKHNGVAAHITEEAFKTQQISVSFKFFPWKRTYLVAKNVQTDATGFWLKTDEREKDFYFSDPIFTIKNNLIYKKNNSIQFENINDLKKIKLAVTKGYSYTQEIDIMIKNKLIDVHYVNSDLAGLKQTLLKNKFDAFLCSFSVANALMYKHFTQKERNNFQFSKPVFTNDVYLMVSKKHKNHRKILNSFNDGLQVLKNDGLQVLKNDGLQVLKKENLINTFIENSFKGKYHQ